MLTEILQFLKDLLRLKQVNLMKFAFRKFKRLLQIPVFRLSSDTPTLLVSCGIVE
jgi:hypothetical protein